MEQNNNNSGNNNSSSYQNMERIVRLETKHESMFSEVTRNNLTVHARIDKVDNAMVDLKKSIDSELKDIKELLSQIKINAFEDKAKVAGGWKVLTVIGGIVIALAGFSKLIFDLFKIHP
jgi:hypothetical protein